MAPDAVFDTPDQIAADTDEVRWWKAKEAAQSLEIREDHRAVLQQILQNTGGVV